MKKLATHILLLCLAISTPTIAHGFLADSLKDSVESQSKSQVSCRLMARLHSLGVFGYGGMIANSSPSFDITFTCNSKRVGVLFIKALDVYDFHSPYNFSLLMVNKPIPFSKLVTFTPYGGLVIEQNHSFIDKGSDGIVMLITSWKTPSGVSFEHCARFSNTCFETKYFDWLNRFRLLYSYEHIDVAASLWHNNSVFDRDKHTSLGLAVTYSRVKVAEQLSLSTSITGVKVTANSDENVLTACSGIALTIAATWR